MKPTRLEAIEAVFEHETNVYRIYRYRNQPDQPQLRIYVPLESKQTEFEYRIVLVESQEN